MCRGGVISSNATLLKIVLKLDAFYKETPHFRNICHFSFCKKKALESLFVESYLDRDLRKTQKLKDLNKSEAWL